MTRGRARMRGVAAALAACAVTALASSAAFAAPAPYVDGISDQNVPYWNGDWWHGGPPVSPFGRLVRSSLVAGAVAPLRFARYVVAYDVMCDPTGPAFATFQYWLADVEQLGLQPVVAFWYGNFDGNRCAGLPTVPSTVAQYNGTPTGGAVAAFLAHFPQVRTIEPWNEPNDGRGPDVAAATAAAFWLTVARTDCAARACDAVIAGDLTDGTANLITYERAYVAALGGVDPVDWGVHPYAAVNRHDPRTLSEFLDGLPHPHSDRVWYTEIGAYYCTRTRNAAHGYPAAVLQAAQEASAHFLVGTLMRYPFTPVHVFYYEFTYKNDLPGPCVTNDSALYGPPTPGSPIGFAPRAAVQDILPLAAAAAAPPQPLGPVLANAWVFYSALDWQSWSDPWRATNLGVAASGPP